MEEDLEPQLLMASTSFNNTQRKASKDTITNDSNWFEKFYNDELSKLGKFVLDKDEGIDDQEHEAKEDYEEPSMEDQQVKENDTYEKGREPKFKKRFWSTITSRLVQKIKQKMKRDTKLKGRK